MMGTMPPAQLRATLEARRRQLDAEIRSYPTPIPRCDAEFNHLMEERDRIVRELASLENAREGQTAGKT